MALVSARVTRDVAPTALADLLADPPRTTVAFVRAGQIDILPARARFADDAYFFGIRADAAVDLAEKEVVLVCDDGSYWFELRGISVRGIACAAEPDEQRGRHLLWYAIEPRRVLSWDYGALREP